MKSLSFTAAMLGLFVAACASATAPAPARSVETTSAITPSPEAFTPPDAWEMSIADKPTVERRKDEPTAKQGFADTTASKRQAGALVNLPTKAPASTPKE